MRESTVCVFVPLPKIVTGGVGSNDKRKNKISKLPHSIFYHL